MIHRIWFGIVALTFLATTASSQQAASMTAHFIDVGQAHATLLEFPCGAMLVDAGSQDAAAGKRLTAYLRDFFNAHPDFKNTLELVLITHNHVDHTLSLPDILGQKITIRRFIDNGWTKGSGAPQVNNLKALAKEHKIPTQVRSIKDSMITSLPNKKGLTDSFIDPFKCDNVDPQVRILSGALEENPDWSADDFKDANNHSVVTRIDFGQASFLFLGDMELPASYTMMEYYDGADREILDADVLQVSHHGARNGTSAALARAVSPEIAVIPVGRWTFGRNPRRSFTTFAYGHPNQNAVGYLAEVIDRNRSEPIDVMLGEKAGVFHKATVSKAIYATDWDGNIRVQADTDGNLVVRRSKR